MAISLILHDDERFFEPEEENDESVLVGYASDAAQEMNFKDPYMLEDAITRAGNVCVASGKPVRKHFKRIYRCTSDGVYCDWKLSQFAYTLVCLNGDSLSPRVAEMQLRLLQLQEELNEK
jgi:hypothetical protein